MKARRSRRSGCENPLEAQASSRVQAGDALGHGAAVASASDGRLLRARSRQGRRGPGAAVRVPPAGEHGCIASVPRQRSLDLGRCFCSVRTAILTSPAEKRQWLWTRGARLVTARMTRVSCGRRRASATIRSARGGSSAIGLGLGDASRTTSGGVRSGAITNGRPTNLARSANPVQSAGSSSTPSVLMRTAARDIPRDARTRDELRFGARTVPADSASSMPV